MNKISKKIVALVTMAAFVLTLVPAAAFAAEPTKSYINTADKNVEVTAGEKVKIGIETNDGEALSNGYVWVEDEGGNVSRDVTFYNGTNGENQITDQSKITVLDNGYALKPETLENGKVLYVAISEAGTYTIHAGVKLDGEPTNTRTGLLPLESDEGYNTIVVDPAEAADLYQVNVTQDGKQVGSAPVVNKGEVKIAPVLPNNTATKTVTLTTEAEGGSVIANKDLQITTSSKNLTVSAADDNYTTNRKGELELTYKASKAGTYYIYVKNADDNFSATLKVVIPEESDIVGITATENNAKVIELSPTADFSDAVQIQMTDDQGDVVANNDSRLTAEPIMKSYNAGAQGAQNVKDYVTIVSQPKGAKLDYSDVKVVPDSETGNFTIAFADGVTDNDLKEGEYTVQFALLNGDNVQVTFTLAKFGEIKDMVIDIADKVAYDGSVSGTVKYVDENGIEKNVTDFNPKNISVGYSGVAVDPTKSSFSVQSLVVRADADKDNIGSVITLTAVDADNGFIASKEITVTDGVTTGSLKFDASTGEADKDNTVNVSVVDEDGNVIKLSNATMYAYVADKSNKDANIEVKEGSVSEGKAKLTVYSDVETTANIVVAVRNDKTGEIYAGTLEYTFGEADVNADKIVAMTIGSTDMIVDNNIVTGDAAPYVADGRTMVPIRALTETFGAKVDYKDNVVTIVDGDTTVVMNIGETTYTVNGEEQTMDVAPVIGSSDRTYVPVRFVAEALGYKVTPLYAADNTTASVVFQK
ncbi:MAG: copper amine oxidase N-terminal domain-containing protein [Peptococcaceae bacterium]|nr:copper amine oxidase N-terminal domain-containing protein [Peptococcaceae bacterium]